MNTNVNTNVDFGTNSSNTNTTSSIGSNPNNSSPTYQNTQTSNSNVQTESMDLSFATEELKSDSENFFQSIGDFFSDIGKSISDTGAAIVEGAKSIIDNTISGLKELGSELTQAATALSSNAKTIIGNINSWLDNSKKALNDTATKLTSKAKNIVGKILDISGDLLMNAASVINRTCASVASVTTSFVQGIFEFGEAIVDTAAILGTGICSIGTGIYDGITWISSQLNGKEWSSSTSSMWENVMGFVATTHVKDWGNNFRTNNYIGKWMEENSYTPFKSDGFISQVANGIGYVTGVSLLTLLTFGVGGLAVSGTSAASSLAITAGQSAIVAGTAGFGKGAETAWSSGAELGEGLIYALANAGWEGLQFYVGAKIGAVGGYGDQLVNKMFGEGASTLSKSLARIGLDAADGGIEGFIQPLLQSIYADGYTSETGEYVEFTDDDTIFDRATEIFDDIGGWKNVAIQTAIGGGGSALGEIGDLTKFLKNNSNEINSTSVMPDTTLATPILPLTALNIKEIIDNAKKMMDIDNNSSMTLKDISSENIVIANYRAQKGLPTIIECSSTSQLSINDLNFIENPEMVQIKIENGLYKSKYTQGKYQGRMTFSLNEAKAISEKIDSIVSQVDTTKPKKEQAMQVYKILGDYMSECQDAAELAEKYGTEFLDSVQGLRALLPNKFTGEPTGVCAGFSSVYYEAMTKLGIECDYVRGKVITDTGETFSHAWNVVIIDNEVIPVDSYWKKNGADGFFGASSDFQSSHIADIDEKYRIYDLSSVNEGKQHIEASAFTRSDGSVYSIAKAGKETHNGTEVFKYVVTEQTETSWGTSKIIFSENDISLMDDIALQRFNDSLLSAERVNAKTNEASGYVGYIDSDGKKYINAVTEKSIIDNVSNYIDNNGMSVFKERTPDGNIYTYYKCESDATGKPIIKEYTIFESKEITLAKVKTKLLPEETELQNLIKKAKQYSEKLDDINPDMKSNIETVDELLQLLSDEERSSINSYETYIAETIDTLGVPMADIKKVFDLLESVSKVQKNISNVGMAQEFDRKITEYIKMILNDTNMSDTDKYVEIKKTNDLLSSIKEHERLISEFKKSYQSLYPDEDISFFDEENPYKVLLDAVNSVTLGQSLVSEYVANYSEMPEVLYKLISADFKMNSSSNPILAREFEGIYWTETNPLFEMVLSWMNEKKTSLKSILTKADNELLKCFLKRCEEGMDSTGAQIVSRKNDLYAHFAAQTKKPSGITIVDLDKIYQHILEYDKTMFCISQNQPVITADGIKVKSNSGGYHFASAFEKNIKFNQPSANTGKASYEVYLKKGVEVVLNEGKQNEIRFTPSTDLRLYTEDFNGIIRPVYKGIFGNSHGKTIPNISELINLMSDACSQLTDRSFTIPETLNNGIKRPKALEIFLDIYEEKVKFRFAGENVPANSSQTIFAPSSTIKLKTFFPVGYMAPKI